MNPIFHQTANCFFTVPIMKTPGWSVIFLAAPEPPGDSLSWMPEGRAIVYRHMGNLWVQPFEGGTPYQLTHFTEANAGRQYAISSDGSRLAIQRGDNRSSDVILFTSSNKNSQP